MQNACAAMRHLSPVSKNCDNPCSGNEKVACGSCSAITVFRFDGPRGAPSPPPTHEPGDGGEMRKYVDCSEDGGDYRVLGESRKDSKSSMTA